MCDFSRFYPLSELEAQALMWDEALLCGVADVARARAQAGPQSALFTRDELGAWLACEAPVAAQAFGSDFLPHVLEHHPAIRGLLWAAPVPVVKGQ